VPPKITVPMLWSTVTAGWGTDLMESADSRDQQLNDLTMRGL
jgi:hypothetical protein